MGCLAEGAFEAVTKKNLNSLWFSHKKTKSPFLLKVKGEDPKSGSERSGSPNVSNLMFASLSFQHKMAVMVPDFFIPT